MDAMASRTIAILLVDDDPAEHLILKRKLQSSGNDTVALTYCDEIGAAVERVREGGIDMVFLDNRLVPSNDFRETAPQLRAAGFTGPIGVISSDISGSFFEMFRDFGVDFRIAKDEIDTPAIRFILSEYTANPLPDTCGDDIS